MTTILRLSVLTDTHREKGYEFKKRPQISGRKRMDGITKLWLTVFTADFFFPLERHQLCSSAKHDLTISSKLLLTVTNKLLHLVQ